MNFILVNEMSLILFGPGKVNKEGKKSRFMMSDKNSSEKLKIFEGKEIMRKSGLQTVIYLL